MDPDERGVKSGVNHGPIDAEEFTGIATDKDGNRRGGNGVLEQNGGAGQKASDRAHGAASKAIAAPGGWNHGG